MGQKNIINDSANYNSSWRFMQDEIHWCCFKRAKCFLGGVRRIWLIGRAEDIRVSAASNLPLKFSGCPLCSEREICYSLSFFSLAAPVEFCRWLPTSWDNGLQANSADSTLTKSYQKKKENLWEKNPSDATDQIEGYIRFTDTSSAALHICNSWQISPRNSYQKLLSYMFLITSVKSLDFIGWREMNFKCSLARHGHCSTIETYLIKLVIDWIFLQT